MGAFSRKKDIITIRDEKNWEPGESCEARTFVRSGDEEWVLNQQMSIQMPKNRKQRRQGGFRKEETGDIEFENQIGAARRLWVQKMLESWTFTDEDEHPILFKKSGHNKQDDQYMSKVMKALDTTYIDFIYEAIMDAQPKEAKEDAQEEEEDEGDEEGSPFSANVLPSTDGETSNPGVMALVNGSTNTEKTSHRNFLAKS